MQDLILERTAKTPQVEFMALERKLTLAGRSIPENSIQFYGPSWIGCKRFVRRLVAGSKST